MEQLFAHVDLPATGGWLLFVLTAYGTLSGRWFVTRREYNSMEIRALKAEANVDELIGAVGSHVAVARLTQATIEAGTKGVQTAPMEGQQ